MTAARRNTQSFVKSIIPRLNPTSSLSQLFFSRGLASTLFVKGISFSSTKEILAEAFSKYGEVLEAKIIMNKARNRSKGYGYVTFAKEDEAQKALMEMNGKLLHGRVIFVDSVRPTRRYGLQIAGCPNPNHEPAPGH